VRLHVLRLAVRVILNNPAPTHTIKGGGVEEEEEEEEEGGGGGELQLH
jgi:hypothetical protein